MDHRRGMSVMPVRSARAGETKHSIDPLSMSASTSATCFRPRTVMGKNRDFDSMLPYTVRESESDLGPSCADAGDPT